MECFTLSICQTSSSAKKNFGGLKNIYCEKLGGVDII